MATALIQRTAGPLPAVVSRQAPVLRRAVIARIHANVVAVTPVADATPSRTHASAEFSLLSIEGEDAKITGGTRSLMRRVLALNLPGSLRPPAIRKSPLPGDN